MITGFSASMNAQVQYVNLLVNPGVNVDTAGWNVTSNLGSGFMHLPTSGYDGTGAIQAGYYTEYSQVIDLVAAGYTIADLDEAPVVRYADWIKGSGPDSMDLYKFEVTLLDVNDNIIATHASSGYLTTNGVNWSQNTHSFVNYGPGLRKVRVNRIGADAEYDQTQTVGVVMDAACLVVGNHFLYASDGTGDLAGWNVTENGGDGWSTANTFWPGWQTSFDQCTKSQVVDLMSLGYTAAELDTEPKITIWEFFIGLDGGTGVGIADYHNMKIELRDASGNVITSYDSGTIRGLSTWQQIGSTFENYGTGLRQVFVEHGGYDQEFWAGHYGGIVDATQMTMEFTPIQTDVNDLVEQNTSNLALYPNPVASNEPIAISIDNEITGTFDLTMTDALGRTVHQSTFEKTSVSQQTSFTPNDLPSGIYQISIKKDGFSATKRININ